MKIIDTHLHFWDLNKFSLSWLNGIDALNQNFLIEDYLKAVKNHSIEKAIYMEVDVDSQQKLSEADYIVSMIQSQKTLVCGAICSGVLGEEGFSANLKHYKKYPEIKGIRHVLHVPIYPAGYCLGKNFLNDLQGVVDTGLVFDICIRPAELKDAVALVDKFPNGIFILDHCGNPNPLLIAGEIEQPKQDPNDIFWHEKDDWLYQIGELGKRNNVICKISGIIARANPDHFEAEHLKPVVEHCIDSFGEDRIIFGSDWPVCELTLGAEVWISSLKKILKTRNERLLNKLFYENAKKVYQL